MAELIDDDKLRAIIDGALLAAGEPLSVDRLVKVFVRGELDPEQGRAQIRECLNQLEALAQGRGYQLKRVASGYRYQVGQEVSEWVSRLWDEKPPRYSRALLETLALVAYKQPVTRGDIEQVRGVSVSPNIMRTMLERGWIRVVGQREVPGRPSMYGTTRGFLDYFNLKSLDQLPPIAEIRALIEPVLEQEAPESPQSSPDVEQLHPGISVEAFGEAVTADTGASETLEPGVRGEGSDEEPPEKLVSAEVVPLPITPQ
ncbi:MAG: SMC-Scp complex subunit ScpB [Gammaproteobacteria bacterium]|nr:SMC-Scp complex subunit ScpB [Gammaproteobacteria bacterium]